MEGFNFEPFWAEVERLRKLFGPDAVSKVLAGHTEPLEDCDYCRGWQIPKGQNCPKCGRVGEGIEGIPGVSAREALANLRDLSAALAEPPSYPPTIPGSQAAEDWSNARPSFDKTFMDIAGIVAKRGTCPRLQVGAVITFDNRIIATGYNGSPAGLPHCTEVGCLIVPDSKGCKRTTHAEANALIQCARMGSSPEDGSIYVTHRPCVACAGLIITAGIKTVWYAGAYDTDALGDEVGEMLHKAGVEVRIWSQ